MQTLAAHEVSNSGAKTRADKMRKSSCAELIVEFRSRGIRQYAHAAEWLPAIQHPAPSTQPPSSRKRPRPSRVARPGLSTSPQQTLRYDRAAIWSQLTARNPLAAHRCERLDAIRLRLPVHLQPVLVDAPLRGRREFDRAANRLRRGLEVADARLCGRQRVERRRVGLPIELDRLLGPLATRRPDCEPVHPDKWPRARPNRDRPRRTWRSPREPVRSRWRPPSYWPMSVSKSPRLASAAASFGASSIARVKCSSASSIRPSMWHVRPQPRWAMANFGSSSIAR